MAAGLLVVLIAGGIDISFAAIAAVSQYLVMTILVRLGGDWVVAFLLSGIFGGALGIVNALLIYYLRALSVIVTISTLTFYFSMLLFVTRGVSIYNLPNWFTNDLSLFGVPFPVLVAAIVLFATAFILSRLSIGRQIYGLGGNSEAASRMGCNIVGLQCFAYGYSGITAGIAGLVQAHRVRGGCSECPHRPRTRRPCRRRFGRGEPDGRHWYGQWNNLWNHPSCGSGKRSDAGWGLVLLIRHRHRSGDSAQRQRHRLLRETSTV